MQAKKQLDVTLEQLLEAGCHFGHQTKRWNPKMAPFIYDSRDGVHVFDLAKTREALLAAYEVIKKIISDGGVILLVGTKRQASDFIRNLAVKTGMPYVDKRWLGGTLTNFEQVARSVKKLSEMKTKREAGDYNAYTKKERLLIDREIANLEHKFGGLATLATLPDMLFVVDTNKEKTVVLEAQKKKIPIVGIVDTNCDPTLVDYPIPANDDAVKSISLILDVVGRAIEEGEKIGKKKEDKRSLTLRVKSDESNNN